MSDVLDLTVVVTLLNEAESLPALHTELIAEFSLGKILETTIDEIAQTIHPHPTISETVMEAAHTGIGGAMHL